MLYLKKKNNASLGPTLNVAPCLYYMQPERKAVIACDISNDN